MSKVAIVTGATGQDGSYLVELLLEKGYEVRCAVRRSTYPLKYSNISKVADKVKIYDCDLADQSSMFRLFEGDLGNVEVYNLAAQSQVGTSFNCPKSTFDINTMGTINLLETIRQLGLVDRCKFYQASTSEMFGKVQEVPQSETTPFYPRSPYGVSKLAAHWIVKNYRESYGLFACSGILFNHESPLRPARFVTQKIVSTAVRIANGSKEKLTLGKLDIRRDWGWAPEYVDAMWRMLQQKKPDDYVVATGEEHSLQQFVAETFRQLGLDWRKHVVSDRKLFRPSDIERSCGNSSKARRKLGFKSKIGLKKIISALIQRDQIRQ